MKKSIMTFLFLSLVLWASHAQATHVSVGAGSSQTGPITTISAALLPKGTAVIEFQTEFLRFDTFSGAQLLGFAAEDREIHNVDSLLHTYLGISFGVSDSMTLHARIPYVYRNNIVESEPPDEIHRHGDAKGYGDTTIHLHHRIVKSADMGFDSSLLLGLKMPTGKTSDKDDGGETFEAEFQPGSGSWDPSIGIAATKRFGRLAVDGNILYTLVTKGTQKTDLGDLFSYNLALSYRALTKPVSWDLVLEANGLLIQKQEVDGEKDGNSGGNIIFLSPGTRLTFLDRLTAFLSVGLPVVQDLNGTQNEVDYRLAFGLTLAL